MIPSFEDWLRSAEHTSVDVEILAKVVDADFQWPQSNDREEYLAYLKNHPSISVERETLEEAWEQYQLAIVPMLDQLWKEFGE